MASYLKLLSQRQFTFLILLLFIICDSVFSEEKKVVDIIEGDDNIIISVPHGGFLEPSSVPDREQGCLKDGACYYRIGCTPKAKKCKFIPRRDLNAYEIGKRLVKTLQSKGRKPRAVFMLLHRKKIDPNRAIGEACQGSPKCETAYHEFHNFIKSSRKAVKGPGLYLDIHTIRHVVNWTELGYRVSKADLNRDSIDGLSSSMNQLQWRTGLSIEELLRGDRSLGNLLSKQGYKVIPSPKYRKPGTDGYARGGYNTVEYGSLKGGCIDGLQVEGSLKLRVGPKEKAEAFADRLAESVLKFMADFGYDDPKTVCIGAERTASTSQTLRLTLLTSFVSFLYLSR